MNIFIGVLLWMLLVMLIATPLIVTATLVFSP